MSVFEIDVATYRINIAQARLNAATQELIAATREREEALMAFLDNAKQPSLPNLRKAAVDVLRSSRPYQDASGGICRLVSKESLNALNAAIPAIEP